MNLSGDRGGCFAACIGYKPPWPPAGAGAGAPASASEVAGMASSARMCGLYPSVAREHRCPLRFPFGFFCGFRFRLFGFARFRAGFNTLFGLFPCQF